MARDYTQMGLAERRAIEESLRKGLSLGRIAEAIGRSKSTVSREILSNRTTEAPKGRLAACMMRRDCVASCVCGEEWCASPGESCSFCKERDCRRFCEAFRAGGRACDRLERPPYVCNGCRYQSGCSVRARWYYSAATADAASKERRSRSRRGIDMEPARAALVLDQVRDAIGRGMSPYEVSVAYAGSIGVSPSTIYRWVERGYAGMANIDLERKVGFRRRRGGGRHRATAHSRRRRYEAFCALGEDVRAAAVEMDTVMGLRGDDACLLTLYLRSCHLQIAMLLAEKSASEVMRAISAIGELAGEMHRELFACVLTDNGAEFADERALGRAFGERGPADTRLFYCDVRASNQKGGCEKNHTEIRQVLPKGTVSFDDLTCRDIAAVMSHVNSNPRKSLCGMSPIEMFVAAYGQDAEALLEGLGMERIALDELVLKPALVNMERRKRGEEELAALP